MRYYLIETDGNEKEISYLEALRLVAGIFEDCQMVRDMLTIPNRIPALGSLYVLVKDEEHPEMIPMPGLFCLVPDGYEYDKLGGRL